MNDSNEHREVVSIDPQRKGSGNKKLWVLVGGGTVVAVGFILLMNGTSGRFLRTQVNPGPSSLETTVPDRLTYCRQRGDEIEQEMSNLRSRLEQVTAQHAEALENENESLHNEQLVAELRYQYGQGTLSRENAILYLPEDARAGAADLNYGEMFLYMEELIDQYRRDFIDYNEERLDLQIEGNELREQIGRLITERALITECIERLTRPSPTPSSSMGIPAPSPSLPPSLLPTPTRSSSPSPSTSSSRTPSPSSSSSSLGGASTPSPSPASP